MKKVFIIYVVLLHVVVFMGMAARCNAQQELATSWQDIVVTELRVTHSSINLTPTLRLYEDQRGRQKLDNIRNAEQRGEFTRPGTESLNLGYRNSAVWLSFSLQNNSDSSTRWLLEFDNPNLWIVTILVEKPDGSFREIQMGTHFPFNQRLMEHRHFLLPLHNILPARAKAKFYVRIISGEPVRIAPKAWQVEAFIAEESVRNLTMGVYYGMLLLIIAYNLLLFMLVRDSSYCFFACFMLLVGVLQLTNNGLTFQFWWRHSPVWNQESRGLMNGLTFCFVALFTRQFLRSQSASPLFHRLLLGCIVAALCLAWYKWISFAEDMEWWKTPLNLIAGLVFWAAQILSAWWFRGLKPHRIMIFVVASIFWLLSLLTSLVGEFHASTFDRSMNTVIPLATLALVISAAIVILRRGHAEGLMFLISMSGAILGGVGEILLHIGVLPANVITESLFKTGIAISAVMFSLPLGGRITALTRRADQLELEAMVAQKALTEARLEALQAKIHPHFLFNTLNSIVSLIRLEPQKAEEAIIRLSKIFRYTLHRSTISRRGTVPLREELEIVEMYVELERLRLAERLRYTVEIEGNIDDVVIPALTVQPLVENSIKYAIAPRVTGGTLALRITRPETTRCVLTLQDDGPGIVQRHPESGHGLQSVRDRIQLVFGDAAVLEIKEQDGVLVTLGLPVRYHT